MTLRSDIAAWDGKTARDIQSVYAQHSNTRGFAGRVARLVREPALQRGATWLLKHHVGLGGSVSDEAGKLLLQAAPSLEHWESRLHLLQCMHVLEIPAPMAAAVRQFLHTCEASDRTLVRAWALNGLSALAAQHPEYRDEVDVLLRVALEDEAGSVRARARNLLK